MIVRMYNKKTLEFRRCSAIDIDFEKDEIILTLEDGQKISFDKETWQSYILA